MWPLIVAQRKSSLRLAAACILQQGDQSNTEGTIRTHLKVRIVVWQKVLLDVVQNSSHVLRKHVAHVLQHNELPELVSEVLVLKLTHIKKNVWDIGT